ncbi:hypothetical protein Slin15195_G076360 [Septoria linicola]|uniref:Uncharacterized protein n=1 Tax=Septoria linicola TaxID=215465 RepID=A0A9Q9ELE9_9PEZI|nr:hypothetical protein Slin15195_G076360 [Septoria linicola]
MARLRTAPGSQAPTSTRQALREKTNTTRASAPVYEDDGDTENLVKDARPKRGRAKRATRQDSDELVMAGGLGLGSDKDAQPQTSEVPTTTDELAKSDGPPAPAAKTNRRPPRTVRKVAASQAQSKVMDEMKKRMNATAQGQRARQQDHVESAEDSSDPQTANALDSHVSSNAIQRAHVMVSVSPPPAGNLNTVQKRRGSVAQPGSVLKAQSTPAVESSLFALKHFKRRPRQPSMLQMVKQKMGSARPSLTNATTMTVDDDAVEDTSAFDLGLSDDDEEDFAPEAEGTPLHVSKKRTSLLSSTRQRTKVQSSVQESASKSMGRKRKSHALGISSGSLSALRNKRQRQDVGASSGSLSGLRARRQQPTSELPQAHDLSDGEEIVVRSSTERAETPQPAITSDIQVINSPTSSTPPTEPPSSRHRDLGPDKEDVYAVPSTERESEHAGAESATRHISAEDDEDDAPNGTMADPVSSPGSVSDDVLADPAAQRASPSPAKMKPRGKPKPMNTAALQSLLPKKRKPLHPRTRRSEYDIESSELEDNAAMDTSHLDDDEDELGGRARRQTKKVVAKSKKTTAGKKGRTSKATAAKNSTGKRAGTKTYGRSVAADKENIGYESFEEAEESMLPEFSHSMQEVAKSKEIEAAKAKFADIDQWDMEFETMSADEHRSSSLNWR